LSCIILNIFTTYGVPLIFVSIVIGVLSLTDLFAGLLIFNWKKSGVYLYHLSTGVAIFLAVLLGLKYNLFANR